MGRPLEEAEPIRRAQRGDTHASEELVHACQGIAFRAAYAIARNAADAEDAAQGVMGHYPGPVGPPRHRHLQQRMEQLLNAYRAIATSGAWG